MAPSTAVSAAVGGAVSNEIFPAMPGLKWDVSKVPNFSTAVQRSVGGREVRAAFQPYPIWQWSLAFEFLRETTGFTEFQQLAGFYTARQGCFDSFLYEDPTDKTATDQNFGTGDGTTVAFQLRRRLGSGGLYEPIYNLNGAPVIKKAGVTQSTPADYSVSSTGLVTFTSPPAGAAALTWSGGYYWRVRFADDMADFVNFADKFWRANQISLVQLLGL